MDGLEMGEAVGDLVLHFEAECLEGEDVLLVHGDVFPLFQ